LLSDIPAGDGNIEKLFYGAFKSKLKLIGSSYFSENWQFFLPVHVQVRSSHGITTETAGSCTAGGHRGRVGTGHCGGVRKR
jgi:hypothetical protein